MISETEKESAKSRSIIEVARELGFELQPQKQEGIYKVAHGGGLFLFERTDAGGRSNRWSCAETDKSGDVIDFVREYGGKSYPEAVAWLLNGQVTKAAAPRASPSKSSVIMLPKISQNTNRIQAWLIQTRRCHPEVVRWAIRQGCIRQSVSYGNALFLGKDMQTGAVRYCLIRGALPSEASRRFRMEAEGSDKRYAWFLAGAADNSIAYCFESPIDALSHASLRQKAGLAWKEDWRISQAGLSNTALEYFLETHPAIRQLVFCYDNDQFAADKNGNPDNHGQKKAMANLQLFAARGYACSVELPPKGCKDFNDSLQQD